MQEAPLPGDDSVREPALTVADNETARNSRETAVKEEGKENRLLHEESTKGSIDSFFAVYNRLDFGFLENVYRGALILELRRRGHTVACEVAVPVFYDGVQIATYRVDMIVDGVVVLELKSTAILNPNDQRQLLNYLRATRLEVGLLFHFGPKPKFYRLTAPNEPRKD